jgi:hypothetical protein
MSTGFLYAGLVQTLPGVTQASLSDYNKRALFDQYFAKDFPTIDPLMLTDSQWHQNASSLSEWEALVRKEIDLLFRWEKARNPDFIEAVKKWNEYYERS